MKVIEKFNYNRDTLLKEFNKYSHRPDSYCCDIWESDVRNSLQTAVVNESATAFVNWAWSEYPTFKKFQIIDHYFLVLNPTPDKKQNIVGVNLFSTGWEYHCDILRKANKDVSMIYAGYETTANMYDLFGHRDTKAIKESVLSNIDGNLRKLKLLPPKEGFQFTIPINEKNKLFYKTFADTILYLKSRILDGKDEWEDMDLLRRMGLGKWLCE